jgi:hypothetical protein
VEDEVNIGDEWRNLFARKSIASSVKEEDFVKFDDEEDCPDTGDDDDFERDLTGLDKLKYTTATLFKFKKPNQEHSVEDSMN